MQDYFAMFALYNRWANQRLYEAAARLGDEDYRKDLGAFFGSVHGTLNHLVVTDRIWMRRFTREGPVHKRLDEIASEDLQRLAALRVDEDERIIGYIETLTESDMAGTFTYSPLSNPGEVTQPLASALAHLFNHQTHHRGQAHGLLTAIGGRDFAPSLDLVLFQRQTGTGMA
jgi:uncharacterized damage-inducible protein DinB